MYYGNKDWEEEEVMDTKTNKNDESEKGEDDQSDEQKENN